MKTANCPSTLQTLEAQLQLVLQEETALEPAIQIRCGLRQGALLVLAQHPIALPNPRRLFALLEQTLQQLAPETVAAVLADHSEANQTILPVRLYLRVLGQTQPYASHAFELGPNASASAIPPELLTAAVAEPLEPIAAEPEEASEADLPGQIVLVRQEAIAPLETAAPLERVAEESPINWHDWRQFPIPLIGLAAAVAIFAFGGTLYALTRPCVLGACAPLQTARQLQQAATQTIETTNSAQLVIEAYEQLNESIYLLSTIPSWSKHYAAAQAQLQVSEQQSEDLEQIVAALQQAQTAAQRSQSPPHPFTEWQEIHQVWQQAIATLKQIPTTSPVYTLAQRKLTEYQSNLTTIEQRMAIERQAQQQVNTARSTVRIAEAREGVAASLDGWQLAYATWQTVVNVLKQVPPNTMANAEAQQLLAIYEPKLAAVRDRHKQEEISANAYNQAISLARQAQASEQRRQWSQAVEHWRNALANAQQVPNNTLHHAQALPLINAYTAALTQAQDTLRTTTAMQSAAADLSRTCTGAPAICDYAFGQNAIRVNITAAYDRAVQQAMTQTQMTGDYYTQAEITAHVNTLLRALAAISENAEVPIELYNSDGSLFGTYMPEFSGYVAR